MSMSDILAALLFLLVPLGLLLIIIIIIVIIIIIIIIIAAKHLSAHLKFSMRLQDEAKN